MALSVKLNQITLFSIADHYTRNKIQQSDLSKRVIGALIGKQDGRFLSIFAATELKFTIDTKSDEIQSIDYEYLNNKIVLMKQVYQQYEFVGWYFNTTAKHKVLSPKDLEFHKTLQKYNDNLILLTIDPTQDMVQAKQLAANTYEMKLDPVQRIEVFNLVQFEIDVDPSETITVESVLKDINSSKQSQFAESLSTMLSSIKTLETKLIFLLSQIENKESNLHKNPKLLIELKEVLNAFPTKKHSIMDLKMLDQGCETNITNFLSAILGVNKMIMNVQSQRNGFESKFIRKYDNMF